MLVGVISIRLMHHDIGFWAAPDVRGLGLTTEAVRLVADWAFDEGLDDVLWEGYVGNLGSAGVARRAGFTYTGTGPGLQPDRDRGHPACWKGRLGRDDDREPKPNWPTEGSSRHAM
nr:GNAT family N-acetyltransferase [Frondihabitans sp. PAMC 28766]